MKINFSRSREKNMSNFSFQCLKIKTIVSYLLQIQNKKHKITNTLQPSKVTLAGESAGSFSSFYHLSSPTRFYSIIITVWIYLFCSGGLFQRLIGQSGVSGGLSLSFNFGFSDSLVTITINYNLSQHFKSRIAVLIT